MTIRRLHTILGQMMANGYGRIPVNISKTTFEHPLEADGCTVLPVKMAEIESVPMVDGDGFTAYTKRGRECTRLNLVLKGGAK